MQPRWKACAAAVGAVVVLGVSLVFIQPAAAARAHRSATTAHRPSSISEMNVLLVASGNMECSNTSDGVKLTITTDRPKLVARLQQQAQARLDRLTQAPASGRHAHRGLGALIASGKLKASVQDLDNGVAVTFSSSDAALVQRLQSELPKAVAVHKAMAVIEARTRQLERVLASGKVTVDVHQTAGGVSVTFASSDPKLAAEIKDRLPACLADIAKNGQLIAQYREQASHTATGTGHTSGNK